MPRIKDRRLVESKRRVRECIRREFEEYMNDGRTYEYAVGKLMAKYGYAESTIYQILKRFGRYTD